MRSILYKLYFWLKKLIAPDLQYSQTLYERVLQTEINSNQKWLDLGCGHNLLPPWRAQEEKDLVSKTLVLVGLDYDIESLKKHKSISFKVRGDISNLPFKESYFDLVTANMVVEHLDNPVVQFQEVNRVLKPRGTFVFHTPNSQSYLATLAKLVPDFCKTKLIYFLQGRREEDIFSTYYRANTPEEITHLSLISGFDVDRIKMIASDAQFILFPPLALIELILLRIVLKEHFRKLRPCIIAVLRKEKI